LMCLIRSVVQASAYHRLQRRDRGLHLFSRQGPQPVTGRGVTLGALRRMLGPRAKGLAAGTGRERSRSATSMGILRAPQIIVVTNGIPRPGAHVLDDGTTVACPETEERD